MFGRTSSYPRPCYFCCVLHTASSSTLPYILARLALHFLFHTEHTVWLWLEPRDILTLLMFSFTLHQQVPDIQELRRVSEDELRSIEDDIKREASEDGSLRQQYGQRWNRPSSVALNSQINEKIAGTIFWTSTSGFAACAWTSFKLCFKHVNLNETHLCLLRSNAEYEVAQNSDI